MDDGETDLKRLVELLRPFADYARVRSRLVWKTEPDQKQVMGNQEAPLTVGDFRCALAAVEAHDRKKGRVP